MTRLHPDDLGLLDLLRARAARHEPRLAPAPERLHQRAAVAVVVHQPAPDQSPEMLFIERAVKKGDPWSGQMAFPGGRMQREDPDLSSTAMRETAEEVGVALGRPLGRLDDVAPSRPGRGGGVVVSPFVYELAQRPEIVINHEVQSAVWVPVSWILHPDSALEYRLEISEFRGSFPAFRWDRYTVWGLTYRVLGSLLGLLDRELPSYERGRASE